MEVFRTKFSGLTRAIALAVMLLQSHCSDANPIGKNSLNPGKKDGKDTVDSNSSNNTPDMTVPMQVDASNDYTGTIDAPQITAAYLVCGKKDSSGKEIGCNVYTAADQRIAAAATTGTWIAKANGGDLTRVTPAPTGIAFEASLPYGSHNPTISVSYSFNDGAYSRVVKTFESNLGSMALINDFTAFGRASDFRIGTTINAAIPTSLATLLSSDSVQRATPTTGFCLGIPACNLSTDSFFSGRGYSEKVTFTIKIEHIGTAQQTCRNIASLYFAILCRPR